MAARSQLSATPPKPVTLPRSLGACADRMYVIDEVELPKLKKLIEKLEKEYKAIAEHLIQNLPKSEANGITGKLARAEIDSKPVPTVKDWDKVYAYIKKTGSFDLLQRRLSTTAVKERWDAKRAIPGVDKFDVIKVKITKKR